MGAVRNDAVAEVKLADCGGLLRDLEGVGGELCSVGYGMYPACSEKRRLPGEDFIDGGVCVGGGAGASSRGIASSRHRKKLQPSVLTHR